MRDVFKINEYGVSKHITINNIHYYITIPYSIWNSTTHSKIKDHIKYWKKHPNTKMKYGSIRIVDRLPTETTHICIKCNKQYHTRSGFLKHMKHHHSHDDITDDLEITDEPTRPDEPETTDEPEMIDEPTVTVEPIMPAEQPITTGYIYCFETESMPGTYKIGMTTRDVDVRLKEANQSNTWKPPIPYQVVFSKYVHNPREKEGMIHTLLSEYRIHPDREFFKLELEKLRCLFGLITEIKE